MLKVLETNELNNILAVVVRYFGGVLLGAGGLVRAYTKSVTNCLSEDNIVELTNGYNININFDYNRIKEVDYLLKDININSKSFDNTVMYNINIPISFLDIIKINNIDYELLKEVNIEK
jgi:putative IMPACT (imprinted ancient) family translation regulator